MADPRSRDGFLATVATRLDLPADIAQGVLEELAGHLHDTVEELAAQGIATGDAESRAIDRLGDAAQLGDELSRVRHGRRQVLAGVGGGVWGLFVEGVRTWIFVAVVGFVAATFALPIASAVIHAQGCSASSLFGGPFGSLAGVFVYLAAGAYLGSVLPARVAGPAVRSVRSVRRVVAVAGLILGSAVLWFIPTLTPDPVLAIGLPLAPVSFAIAALRAPERPQFRVGLIPAVAVALVVIVPMALLAVVSATESPSQSNWMADTAAFGDPPIDADSDVMVDWDMSDRGEPAAVTVRFTGTSVPPRFSGLRYELWAADVDMGVVRFGNAPLATATAPVNANEVLLPYQIPRLRDPLMTATFIVGIRADGARTLLLSDVDFEPTAPWRGTLFDWWSGRP